ncbi:unnamed protein product [Leuciscus chuanchicus]
MIQICDHKLLIFLLLIMSVLACETTEILTFTGYEGGKVEIRCPYESGYEEQNKYLCRGECPVHNKDIPVESGSPAKDRRFSLTDDRTTHIFTVTITDLRTEDQGKHWCSVRTGLGKSNVYTEINLEIKPVSVVSRVTGEHLNITCYYNSDLKNKIKLICKGSDPSLCETSGIKASSETNSNGRFSLRDDESAGVFTVTITDLILEDSGIYWCGAVETGQKNKWISVTHLNINNAKHTHHWSWIRSRAVEREHLQRDESLKSLAAPPSCLPAALSGAYILLFYYSVFVCVCRRRDTHSKRASVFFKMPSCGSCRATLSDGDRHVVCVSCLGEEHAALALADGGCPHCELMAMATLRTRLAVFTETASPPAAASRRKKRLAQRAPEPSLSRQSSPVRPLASPASSVSLPDGQRPPSAAASVDIADEEALLGEDDSCSILASGSEDWAGSEDPAPPARTSSGKRASIEAELMRVLAQAAASLGLEWSSPEQPAHNRLDGFFLPGERASPASRPAPFLPELHEEVGKSWNRAWNKSPSPAPYSARVRLAVSLAFSAVDDAKNKGYLSLPPVEEAIAAHLCPPSAGRRAKPALPSKACRTTSSLLRRAFSAAGQAASALHTMAMLQIFQADLLRKLDEEGPDAICVPDLRSATDLALRATKSAAQAIGRTMASLTVSERHLWLTLSEMAESERTAFLDAPLSATGLFGSSVKDFAERFAEVQKASQAMKHFQQAERNRLLRAHSHSHRPLPPLHSAARPEARDRAPAHPVAAPQDVARDLGSR